MIKRRRRQAGIEKASMLCNHTFRGAGLPLTQTRNPRLVQKLLGHTNLETTAIYMDLVGDEARAEVIGAW